MWSMDVVLKVCGGRRNVRRVAVWAVLVGGFCSLSLNFIRVATFAHSPGEDKKEEKREMMDGNDDGEMMGRADNEGESEIELNEKRKNEEQIVESESHGRDDDNEMHDKRHIGNENMVDDDDCDDDDDDNDDDDDAKTNDVQDGDKEANTINNNTKNNNDLDGQKIEAIQKENETNALETQGEIKIEDKQAQQKEESKQGTNLLEMELKPDLDKPLDEPKIEEKNTPESGIRTAREKSEGGEGKTGGGEKVPRESPMALSGSYALNETLNGRPVVKVLIVAYQRSGSSFTGELLASEDGAFYLFEPLYPWRKHLAPDPDPAFEGDAAKLLGDLLDCSPEVISRWRKEKFRIFRKLNGVEVFCKDANFRLLKTIRARASFVLPWLTLRQDIKVVHLVRDPRGMLNSVSNGGDMWTDRNRDAAIQCANIKSDLSLEQLGPQRYLRVRYEDLVDRPQEETIRVFSFMGVPVGESVLTFLKQHTGMTPGLAHIRERYMNTYRHAKFRHDHWREELDKQKVEQIQDACLEIMSLLQYPILQSSP